MKDPIHRDPIAELLGAGETAATPALSGRVIAAMRSRRRQHRIRRIGVVCAVLAVLAVTGSVWRAFTPARPAPPYQTAADVRGEDPPRAQPRTRETLGYLLALTNAQGGELTLPDPDDYMAEIRPLRPLHAAEWLRGFSMDSGGESRGSSVQ
ncbi:MAG: hypothetical protein JNK25_02070 [Phycisphaerae bacterium]|nr:hypothetical protein [Phycisphaerae bacterium]